jgi:hypothetical protein
MTKSKKTYKKPVHRFPVIIRDRDHFTAIISTLNSSCNAGIENWTMTKKVGKYLRRRGVPVTTEVLIFNDEVNTIELETFVKLL